jgi:hypothetical protein
MHLSQTAGEPVASHGMVRLSHTVCAGPRPHIPHTSKVSKIRSSSRACNEDSCLTRSLLHTEHCTARARVRQLMRPCAPDGMMQCPQCLRWFHRACGGVRLVSVPLGWCCSACTVAVHSSPDACPTHTHRIHTASNGARAHGARAKAGAKCFFLSSFTYLRRPLHALLPA